MKSLLEFKSIVEEEKSDYSKFDVLVRAGLANKAQMQRIHKILDKMQEEKPVFNNADRAILQNMFNRMVDLVSNNKQIFTQARKVVREDINEDTSNPPFVLLLKRKAIRLYPDGTKIALYYNDRIKRVFSIPYNTDATPVIQAEETDAAKTLETPGTNYTKKKFANGDDEDRKINDKATAVSEAVDAIGQLQKIKDTHQHGTVNHKDGSASKIDVQTAHAVLTVHKSLNDENKKKFADMVARSSHHMQKAADFSWKHLK